MKKTITLGILLLCIDLFFCSKKDLPVFSGENAFEYLVKQCDFGPRNPGSEGHEKCLEFLTGELKKYANLVKKQEFIYHGEKLDKDFTMTNIIASFNMNPLGNRRILLCAHWDTRPFADKDPNPENRNTPIIGANDGASGVAVLLEIAKILANNVPPPVGVDIILFDGEDYGESGDIENFCLGSREFVRKKGEYRPDYAILLDMIGDKDLSIPIEENSQVFVPELVEKVWKRADKLNFDVFKDETGSSVFDDHVILNRAGIRAVDIIDFDYPYWHTIADTPDKCSPQSLYYIGTLLVSLIYD